MSQVHTCYGPDGDGTTLPTAAGPRFPVSGGLETFSRSESTSYGAPLRQGPFSGIRSRPVSNGYGPDEPVRLGLAREPSPRAIVVVGSIRVSTVNTPAPSEAASTVARSDPASMGLAWATDVDTSRNTRVVRHSETTGMSLASPPAPRRSPPNGRRRLRLHNEFGTGEGSLGVRLGERNPWGERPTSAATRAQIRRVDVLCMEIFRPASRGLAQR